MAGIKSIDKLREKIRLDVNNPWSDLKGDLLSLCDKVEREIDERYMELPLDADGVPIHVGDELCGYGRPNGGVTVSSITGWGGVIVTDKGMTCNPAKNGLLWDGQVCRHIKPRTLEDVLQKMMFEWVEAFNADHAVDFKPKMLKYADELRSMGVGE